jgi:hypothetical protein
MAHQIPLVDSGSGTSFPSRVEKAIATIYGSVRVPRREPKRGAVEAQSSPSGDAGTSFGNGNVLVASGVPREALLGW